MITPRENFIRFLKNEKYEWIPSSQDQQRVFPDMIPDNISRGLISQQEPYTGEFGGKDWFGVDWYYDPAAGGSMEKAPLLDDPDELEDWESKVVFPNLSELDWEGCARKNRDFLHTGKLNFSCIYTGFFERLISFVGFEAAAMALIDEEQQEHVHRLFDRLADFYIELIRYMHRYLDIEIVEIHDDWGTQISTMFSVETHKEMIVPYVRKVVDAAHAEGVFIEQHSCGKLEKLVPNIISSGVDTWRGQAINDKEMLVNTYGNQFKFGVEIRPAGSVSDETVLQMLTDTLKKYHGKKIWLAFARSVSPAQKEMLSKYLRSQSI